MESAGAPSSDFPSPQESVTKRYKLIWRLLLISNLALGAYIFARPKKKHDTRTAHAHGAGEKRSVPTTSSYPSTSDENLELAPVSKPVKVLQQIPEEQQRELFKWMLDEKRKAKPKDVAEKRRIDLEKAILKDFIRARSVPGL